MALLAQHSNSSALVPTSGPDTGGGGGGGGGLSIQDVTDDPEYADYGNEKDASPEQDWWPDEKALVDYAHGREVAHPRVFDPQETSRVVSNGGKKPSLLPQPGPPPPSVVATTKRGVADGKSKKPLAPHHQEEEVVEEMPRRDNLRLIDVEVGRPCSKLVECGCRGFKPHQWRKICVHCRHERSDHELAPHQSLNVYERLGIKPPQGSMPGATAAAASSAANNANSKPTGSEPGSAGHGYTWVPPGLNRKKASSLPLLSLRP